jgi:hypothetical protein
MDNPVEHYWNIKLNHLKENLEKNNFEVFVAASLQEVHSIVMKTLLPRIQPASISWGGSMTFVASGLYDELKQSRSMTVLDTFDKDISAEESLERRRQSLLVDLYITGTNALTESGMLVNLDMIGNRIAALTFGPKDVILIIGRNKIVPGLEEAMDRVKDIAAPANAMRLDKKTPCVKTASCHECKSPDRICNTWTITQKSFPKGRVKIILLNQDAGL